MPAPKIRLRSAEFRKSRETAWRTLEDLISRVESKGVTHLSVDELQQLPLLYRATASSLSVARSVALDRNLVLYLENLVLRAFFVVYSPRVSILETLGRFLRRDFPAAVRDAIRHIVLATIAIALVWSSVSCLSNRAKPGSARRYRKGWRAVADLTAAWHNCATKRSSHLGPALSNPSWFSPMLCFGITPPSAS